MDKHHVIRSVQTAVRICLKVGEMNEKISMGLDFPVNHHYRFYLGDSFNSKMDMGNKSAGMVKSAINSQLKMEYTRPGGTGSPAWIRKEGCAPVYHAGGERASVGQFDSDLACQGRKP